jgi:hypothetical protein
MSKLKLGILDTVLVDKLLKSLDIYNEGNTVKMFEENLIFKLHLPIFVARQLRTHSASYIELSRRYVKENKVPFEFYINPDFDDDIKKRMEEHNNSSIALYKTLLKDGVSTQEARGVIPVSSYTTKFVKFNLDNFVNLLDVRFEDGQQQIVKYCLEMSKLYLKNLISLRIEIKDNPVYLILKDSLENKRFSEMSKVKNLLDELSS